MRESFKGRSGQFRLALTLAAVVLFGGALHAGNILASNNFAAVVPGAVYRSAQPDPAELRRYQDLYGIKTVINLRGAEAGQDWYGAETAAAAHLGLTHVDFRMSASTQLSSAEAADLITLLKTAEKPVLIHCKAGSDRTGLAAALYLAAIAGTGEEEAERQLSIRYGHFSVPFLSAAYPMDETFEALEPMLGYLGS